MSCFFFVFFLPPSPLFFFYVCASTDSSVYVNESSVLFVPAVQWQHFHKNKKLPSLQSVCLAEDCQKDRLGLFFFFHFDTEAMVTSAVLTIICTLNIQTAHIAAS